MMLHHLLRTVVAFGDATRTRKGASAKFASEKQMYGERGRARLPSNDVQASTVATTSCAAQREGDERKRACPKRSSSPPTYWKRERLETAVLGSFADGDTASVEIIVNKFGGHCRFSRQRLSLAAPGHKISKNKNTVP